MECAVNWNSFNKPVSIFAGLDGSEFEYGVNGRRTRQLIFEGGTVRKKIYVAETFEIEEILTNPTETDRSQWVWALQHTRIYIDTPVGRVGIYEQAAYAGGAGAVTRSWTHKDPLDSVIAVSGESPFNIEWCSFDAWGNRRNADDWTASPAPALLAPSATDRGFTGHEQLDHLQLVHMNGRIYDPVIARFISPDPVLQFPENLQSFNRYSYVLNRPLSLTDPSGFQSEGGSAAPNEGQVSDQSEVAESSPTSHQDQIGQGSETDSAGQGNESYKDGGGNNQSYTPVSDQTADSGAPGTLYSAEEYAALFDENGVSKKAYKTEEAAAEAAGDLIVNESRSSDQEMYGFITCETIINPETGEEEKQYRFTQAVYGKRDFVDVDVDKAPDGWTAAYHTHGDYDPTGKDDPTTLSGNHHFVDDSDAGFANKTGKNVYLTTPEGAIKKFTGKRGTPKDNYELEERQFFIVRPSRGADRYDKARFDRSRPRRKDEQTSRPKMELW